MISRRGNIDHECILIDLNTQWDFCAPDGARPVANATHLIPALRKVFAWGKRNYAPFISSIESIRPSELPATTPTPYCVDGTHGQEKLGFTVFPLSTSVEVDNTLTIPADMFDNMQQVIFRKRSDDLLANPKADRFVTSLSTKTFIIVGNAIERSIKSLALALIGREKHVTIVSDACGYWNRGAADLALRQVAAKGAEIITVEQLRARCLNRRFRYPFFRPQGTTNVTIRRTVSKTNGSASRLPTLRVHVTIHGANGKMNGNGKHV